MKKKCPKCNSTKYTKNEKGESHCKNCGYINSNELNPTITKFK